MSHLILSDQRRIWRKNRYCKYIYRDFYSRILRYASAGLTLEIGGGSGNLKEFLPNVISTDLVPSPWLDAAADAQRLPFVDKCLDNIVCVDVLHHIESPVRFLRESSRILKPGGKLLMVEPAITPISWLCYRCFHPEPVKMGADPLCEVTPDSARVPFDANQAIPTLLFGKYRRQLEDEFPEFKIEVIQLFSLFAYPLSGGFRNWCLIPAGVVKSLLVLEEWMSRLLGPLMAFRIFVVLEKRVSDSQPHLNTSESRHV